MGLILAPVWAVLRRVPVWVWIVAIALAWGAYQRHQVKVVAATLATQQENAAKARESALAADIEETTRRLAAQAEVARNAEQSTLKARSDAAAADLAARRLRARLAVYAADCRPAGAAAAGAGQAASAAAMVLTDVLGQCVDRVRVLAAYADGARVAGLACESSYDALMR